MPYTTLLSGLFSPSPVGPLKESLISFMEKATNNFDSLFETVVEILTEPLNFDAIAPFSTVLQTIALQIAGICLLIELAQVATKVDILKWEHGLKICVKMVLTVVFISNLDRVLRAFYDQGVELVSSVGGVRRTSNVPASWWSDRDSFFNQSIAPPTARLGEQINENFEMVVSMVEGTWQTLAMFMIVLVLLLAVFACGIVVRVIAYLRMFELSLYIIVSPLPCGFFPLGNGDGSGFSRITTKFIKSFAAVCLQGMMIIICLQLFTIIVSGTLDQIIDNLQTSVESNDDNFEWVRLGRFTEASAVATEWTLLLMAKGDGTLTPGDAERLERLNTMYRFTPRHNGIDVEKKALKSEFIMPHVLKLCFTMLIGSIVLLMGIQKCGGWAKSILDAT